MIWQRSGERPRQDPGVKKSAKLSKHFENIQIADETLGVLSRLYVRETTLDPALQCILAGCPIKEPPATVPGVSIFHYIPFQTDDCDHLS